MSVLLRAVARRVDDQLALVIHAVLLLRKQEARLALSKASKSQSTLRPVGSRLLQQVLLHPVRQPVGAEHVEADVRLGVHCAQSERERRAQERCVSVAHAPLFTFCPPAPPLRTNCTTTSSASACARDGGREQAGAGAAQIPEQRTRPTAATARLWRAAASAAGSRPCSPSRAPQRWPAGCRPCSTW